jgi:hypothetical protein
MTTLDWRSHTTHTERALGVRVHPSTGPGLRPRAETDRELCPECLGSGEWYGADGLLVDVCPTCNGRRWL